jgi:hypothetical protein
VPIQYRLDETNRIQFINEAWCEFAVQNGAEKLNVDYIVGNLIWKFIAGKEVQQLYDLIFKAVRKAQKDAVFSFRCDSPAYRRYLHLTVSPLPDGALMLSTEQIREVSRSAVPLLDLDTARGEQYLTICSWCIKARLPSKKWVELEEAINYFDILGRKDFPKLTHGICLECVTKIKNELENLR